MDVAFQALIAALGAFAFVCLVFLLLGLLCRSIISRPRPKPYVPPPVAGGEPSSFSCYDDSLKRVSLPDLADATGGFSPDAIIGDGSFGFVYKAVLPGGGGAVAIKRLNADHSLSAGYREFRAEVDTLGRLRHPNLARLLGYCATGRDRLLVYELVEHGSLDHWLHQSDQALAWPMRLRAARGAASALAFLHHGCQPPVLHRDIKAANVLLDAGFEARIADFGLARLLDGGPTASHVTTQAAGTAGYMAPEIRAGTVGASAKADVYSFGVLLVEMVTGRRPSWPVREDCGKEVEMVQWARKRAEEKRVPEIVDRRMAIAEQGTEIEEATAVMNVACRCIEELHRQRPTMEEVVELLKLAAPNGACED